MTATPHFHVAIAVGDIDEAMARFAETLGVDFFPPTLIRIPDPDDPDAPAVERRVTYSRQGPPFIELLEPRESGQGSTRDEGADDGVDNEETAGHEVHVHEGPHHIGFFVPDLEGQLDALRAAGLVEERHEVGRDGRTSIWMTDPSSFFGTRLELFDAGMEPYFSPDLLERFFAKSVRNRPATGNR